MLPLRAVRSALHRSPAGSSGTARPAGPDAARSVPGPPRRLGIRAARRGSPHSAGPIETHPLSAAAELHHDGQELTSRGASLAERFAFYERKAVLLEQIAAADPDDPAAGQAARPPVVKLQEARRRANGG